jgi:hypothetical protein
MLQTAKKTAFLILAHQWPQQLRRLIARLEADWAHCFVHIDAKSDIAPFRQALASAQNAAILPDERRVKVYWGGFSVVRATLQLIRFATENDSGFGRFCLLSGTDYPVRPLSEIAGVFSGDDELICVDRRLDRDGDTIFDRSARHIFLGDNGFARALAKIPLLKWAPREIGERLGRRKFPFPIYQGSQWWCLTAPAVKAVVQIMADESDYGRWFRYTRIPDEMVFHTALKTTAYAVKIAIDRTVAPSKALPKFGLHYLTWARPNPTSPRCLDMSDYDELTASKAFFARKFHPVISRDLMDIIDRQGTNLATKKPPVHLHAHL